MLQILLNVVGLAFATIVGALAILSTLILTFHWDSAMRYLVGA